MTRLYPPFGTLDPPDTGGTHFDPGIQIDTLYVYHKSRIVQLYRKWRQLLPTAEPYYAIKCNPAPVLLDTLAECGVCFDAASPAEIEAAFQRVPGSNIIYANPCKSVRDIQYAESKTISLTTFDNENEYEKIVANGNMNMLLRIYASDISAKCVLSNKYGAMPDEWQRILKYIRDQHDTHRVVGVSFHIGSGANDPAAFASAISAAREVFGVATALGFTFSILDIGGGFSHANIEDMAVCINASLDEFQHAYPATRVVAEPGRYFAETSADLYTKIIGVRTRNDTRHYWINDSLYGSFNCIMYDHARPVPIALTLHNKLQLCSSTIWGSTCDGIDKIIEDTDLPPLAAGDWLYWKYMGAYTRAAATHFNGIPFADIQSTIIS